MFSADVIGNIIFWPIFIGICLWLIIKVFKAVTNACAFVFALILTWILIEPKNRAEHFSMVCDNMFGKKTKK